MKTKWTYSLEFDALKVLETAHQLKSGFYQSMGFVVKDFDPMESAKSNKGVIFPKLNYTNYPNFWESVMQLNYHEFPIEYNKELVNFICNELKSYNLKYPEQLELKKEWTRIQPRMINKICDICGLNKKNLRTLTIYITHFGAGASFHICESPPFDISICVRMGSNVQTITSSILSALLKNQMFKDLAFNWQESSAVIDWLLHKSALSTLIYNKSGSLLSNLRSVSKRAQESSAQYLTQLGLSPGAFEFKIVNDKCFVDQKEINNLTKSEKSLLAKFITKKNITVSYYAISEVLQQTENMFSLYAISKSVQRLRDKLSANNISSSYIQVIRGEGYKLISA